MVTIGVRHNAGEVASELLSIPPRLDAAIVREVVDGTGILHAAMRAEIPRSDNPGPHAQDDIQRRLKVGPDGRVTGELTTNNEVLYYRWSGTRPHRIEPKVAKALRFRGSSGNFVFARGVNHPGTRPHPWIEAAAEKSEAAIKAGFERAVGEVL